MAGNYVRTEEHKRMMSEKMKGRKCCWLKGKKRPSRSKKWCENISKSRKGKYTGEDNSFFGKHHSDKTRKILSKKISLGLIGNRRRKGVKHTEGIKIKISNTLKGIFSKEKNPNWRGGITDRLKVLRYSDKYFRWRDTIFKRDNYQCVVCRAKEGGNFNAHHIFSFALYPELRFDKRNGITVCKKCHKLLHRIFGREPKVIPNLDWVLKIVRYCEHHKIPVYIKDNLTKYYAECRGYKQFPEVKA